MAKIMPSIHSRGGSTFGDYETGHNPRPHRSMAAIERERYLNSQVVPRAEQHRDELNEAGVAGDKTMVRKQICGTCGTIDSADSEMCKSCGSDPKAGYPKIG